MKKKIKSNLVAVVSNLRADETVAKVLLIAAAFIVGGILIGMFAVFKGDGVKNGIENIINNFMGW